MVDTHALGECAAGTLLWRQQGVLRLTVVAKARFRFNSKGELSRCEAPAFASADLHANNQPLASVEQSSDRVPKRLLDEVVVIGAAHAPQGRPVEQMYVRLALSRGQQWLINKPLEVLGSKRDGRVEPFERMPLGYERTYGGVGIRENPLGCIVRDGGGNVRYPSKPQHVAGFAPMSTSWLTRAAFAKGARGLSAPQHEPDQVMELPDDFDFRFFQCAPSDQHVAGLTIGDGIVLEGFFAEVPRIAFEIPNCEAACAVFDEAGAASPRRLLLAMDLLQIHTERRTLTVSWRGSVPLAADQDLAEIAVAAGVFAGGETPALPSTRQQLAALPPAASVASIPVSVLADADIQTLAPVAARTLPIRVPTAGTKQPPVKSPFPLAHAGSVPATPQRPSAATPWSARAAIPVLPPVKGAQETLDPFAPSPLTAATAPAMATPQSGATPQSSAATLIGTSLQPQPSAASTPLQQQMREVRPRHREVPAQGQRTPGAPWGQTVVTEVSAPQPSQSATLDIFARQALAGANAAAAPTASKVAGAPLVAPSPPSNVAASAPPRSATPSVASAASPSLPLASTAVELRRDGAETTEPRWAPIDKIKPASVADDAYAAPKSNVSSLLYGDWKDDKG